MNLESHPLPDGLLTGSHHRARLALGGIPAADLRTPLWTPSNRGLWYWSGAPDTALERIRRAAPLAVDKGAIGGWAAALLHGAPYVDGQGPDGEDLPVLVCLPRSARTRRTRGVRVYRSDLADDEITVVDGVLVTSVARTCADLARLTTPWRDAVVAVDGLLAAHPEALQAGWQWLEEHPHYRGVRQARRVLALAAAGVASPQETRLRLLWVLDAGLPTPLVNAPVVHVDGRLLGIGDLVDPNAGLVGEFDGGHHASAAQRSIDHQRREGFEDAGLIVVQHTSEDLGPNRRRAIERLRHHYRRGLSRDRSRDRWRVP